MFPALQEPAEHFWGKEKLSQWAEEQINPWDVVWAPGTAPTNTWPRAKGNSRAQREKGPIPHPRTTNKWI